MSKYCSTFIYKIICKDVNVTDCYVGHTTNYSSRIRHHEKNCIKLKTKLYDFINNNGGWNNWNMDIVEHFPCKSLKDAREREQYWIIQLNATLNERKSFVDPKEWRQEYYETNREIILTKKQQHRQKPEVKKQEYEKHKEWKVENKQHYDELMKKWRAENKEHINNYSNQQYHKNKDNINKRRRDKNLFLKELSYYNF